MTINFFLNWNEYHQALEFFRHNRRETAPEKVIGGLLLVASALWFFLDDLNMAAVIGLVVGLIVIFVGPIFRRWGLKRKWEREPIYQLEHAVSFSEEGIHFLMGRVESNLDWGYYQQMIESPDGFLLVYGNDAFNFFPKRAFNGEKMINEFRALAQKKLKKKDDSERTT
jgi:hypothetical protein